MSSDATGRLQRLLSVIPLFADAEYITRTELEERTGADLDELLEDLRVVTERLDAPGGFVEDLRVGVESDRISIQSSHFRRPTRISASELCALELGLAMLRSSTPPEDGANISSARAKLASAIVGMASRRVDGWHAEHTLPPKDVVLPVVAEAAKVSRKVRIEYQSARAIDPTERLIHPYYVIFSHGYWYVIAFCELSEGLRFFRADRVSGAELHSDVFERSPSISLGELLPSGKAFQGSAETLIVRYSPEVARWIAEREGLDVGQDGYLVVHHQLAEDEWAVRHVLQYGPEAEVLAPERVRQKVMEVLKAMAQ